MATCLSVGKKSPVDLLVPTYYAAYYTKAVAQLLSHGLISSSKVVNLFVPICRGYVLYTDRSLRSVLVAAMTCVVEPHRPLLLLPHLAAGTSCCCCWRSAVGGGGSVIKRITLHLHACCRHSVSMICGNISGIVGLCWSC
jgi:hypothetical protein